MSEVPEATGRPPLTAAQWVNAACNRFEQAWQADRRPRIEDYLAEAPEPRRGALLRELVALEIDLRRQAGEEPTAAEYQARFPDLSLDPLPAGRTVPESAPRPGETVGFPAVPGYEILGELGRGGMGVVYQARQLKLDRVVALKMILVGAYAGEAELRRFQHEAAAVAALQHPHIVQIHEVGDHGGLPYFSLEFVEGGSLASRLDGTLWQPQPAAQLVETLARAMHTAHERYIVHRDLKPANVLLTADGQPKITDFGLAKRLDNPALKTQSGAILGTPSYMAPEQASGQLRAIGPATDVYGLGAILYELLTGRPPFQAATPLETVLQVLSEEPIPVRHLHPGVNRDLETICLKCLQKEPNQRYDSAAELADDLQRFRAGEPIRARPVSLPERVWKSVKRRPELAILLVSLFLATSSCLLPGLIEGGLAVGFAIAVLVVCLYRVMTARMREVREKLQQARRIVDDCYTQVARRWLTNEHSTEDLQREFLMKMQDLYEVLAEERGGDPSISRETGLAHSHVGLIFHRALGNVVEADRSYVKAITIQEQLCQLYPTVAVYRQDLADSLHSRGILLQELGLRPQEAEQVHSRAPERQEQLSTENPEIAGQKAGYMNQGHLTVIVFAGSPGEASIVRSFLETNGITAYLAGEHVATAGPYLTAGARAVTVFVAQAEAERARELLVGRLTEDFRYPC